MIEVTMYRLVHKRRGKKISGCEFVSRDENRSYTKTDPIYVKRVLFWSKFKSADFITKDPNAPPP